MREETGVISDCERDKVVLRNGGVSRFGIVYSLDYGRLMGVPHLAPQATNLDNYQKYLGKSS